MTDNSQLARVLPLVIPGVNFAAPVGARSADLPMPDFENFHEVAEILAQVHDEMEAQDEKWGQQNHPLIRSLDPYHVGGGSFEVEVRAHFAEKAESEKRSNDLLAEDGTLDWRGILLEEVYEALTEDDADKAVVELVQVAAVAIQAALSIKRNGLGGESYGETLDAA